MTQVLRHDEAEDRAQLISVVNYSIELDLTVGDDYFASTTTIRFRCAQPGASTFLDVAPHELRSVSLNGRALDVAGFSGRRLSLTDLAADNEIVVDAVMSYSNDGEGLHRSVDCEDGRAYLYAMSFLDAAPRWFACFDQPDLKAPVSMAVRCADDWTVAGNGPATRGSDGVWRLSSPGPLATYFVAIIAGPYVQARGEHDGIPLVLHARASLAGALERDAPGLLAHTANCLDELHRLFGTRYPWGEYHQAFVPDFSPGAMENPGCVTISEHALPLGRATEAEHTERNTTIAHEMAHMWFGNLVTMRWWDDLWLNESFAEYLGQRVVGDAAWVSFGARRKSWGYAADRRPSTHPVAGNDARDTAAALTAFDGISYAKGASVLRQLATHLGDELFLAGLRGYIGAHAHGNATFADLASAWTTAGAENLERWLTAWLRTTGVDELTVADGAVHRRGSRPHAVTVQAYAAEGSELMHRPLVVDTDRVECPVPAGAVLSLPDAFDDTWAKSALADWTVVPELLPRIADPRTRTSVWNALMLAVADTDIDPQLALDVVVAGLPLENETVVRPVARWTLVTLLGTCTADPRPGIAAYHEAWLRALASAEPGSDAQLTAARQVAVSAVSPEILTGWLAGTGVPDGLTVDRELRWAALLRLARLGAVDTDRIDEEQAADRSMQGHVDATRCRAVLPTTEAKAAAWDALINDPARSNLELYALAEGFWGPAQRAVTDPYVERYVSQINSTAALRGGWVVGRVATLAFPWTAADRPSLERLSAMLADDSLDTAIRRSVTDAVDDLRRAVEYREVFG